MIKITIDHWKLVQIAKEHPEIYNKLREYSLRPDSGINSPLPEIKTSENGSIDIGWHEFQAYVNGPDDIWPELHPHIIWRPFSPLTILKEGQVMREPLQEAVKMNMVRLPDNIMLQLTKVDHLDDACTDEVANKLEEGWRIIAVIPQPGQRRPDYIFGRL